MDEKIYTQCQSCGMPLAADKSDGGTNKDGSKSQMYCSLCYKEGKFINPNMTVREMQKLVERILRDEVKMNLILRWFAVKQIPTLKRWKQSI